MVVDTIIATILLTLNHHKINIKNATEIDEFVKKNGYPSLLYVITFLEKKGFVTIEGDEVSLLIKQVGFEVTCDGKIYAFDGSGDKSLYCQQL